MTGPDDRSRTWRLSRYLPNRRAMTAIAVTFLGSAAVGGFMDWQLWADEGAIVVTLAAGALIAAGTMIGILGRGIVRRTAIVVAVVGLGLIGGQILGPEREPLIYQDGTMTIRLTGPVVATATGTAFCLAVASGTEFEVTGDANMRLETADRPFLTALINFGDRWEGRQAGPRHDGVRLDLYLADQLVPNSGKAMTTTRMVAGPTSFLDASFAETGGSLRFADLLVGEGGSAAIDPTKLAGTIEWTCTEAAS